MITKINGLDARGTAKDPRRKTQRMQFKNGTSIPYQYGYSQQYSKQKNNTLLTSVAIVAGSILFTVGYFVLSALAMSLKK